MIDYYDFGKIRIDGKEYEDDVKIINSSVIPWRYIEHHTIKDQDLIELVEQKPKVIVCGIGSNGLVKVTDEAKELAEKNKIKLIIQPSGEAVRSYNDLLQKNENVMMIIHLTC